MLCCSVLPEASVEHAGAGTELILQAVASLASIAGIFIAYLLFVRRPLYAEFLSKIPGGSTLWNFWFSGWGLR